MREETFAPMGDHVLVKRTVAEGVTKGGIYLPDSILKKPCRGIVVAIGPGKMGENGISFPLDIQVGDEVFFCSYSGTEYQDEFMILSENEILGVLE